VVSPTFDMNDWVSFQTNVNLRLGYSVDKHVTRMYTAIQ